jgi:diamine N-acetyltransferase
MEHVTIRKAPASDLLLLRQISVDTFSETFSSGNTPDNMQQYLDEAFSENRLQTELLNPESLFYFAEDERRVAGYLKLNFGQAQTEMRDEDGLEIERIYVLQRYQGKRIGQLLFDHAIDIARLQGCSYVWLGVWEKNSKAISFYEKNGFIAFDKHPFRVGNDVQTDIMMRLPLAPR